MLIGYNTNITYKGKVYHVQTEDSGVSNPSVVTLLYHKGAILRSVKTSYAHLIGTPDLKEQLREIMKQQHKEMIKSLIAGKHESKEETAANPPPDADEEEKISNMPETAAKLPGKSLDEILLDHISRKVKKR